MNCNAQPDHITEIRMGNLPWLDLLLHSMINLVFVPFPFLILLITLLLTTIHPIPIRLLLFLQSSNFPNFNILHPIKSLPNLQPLGITTFFPLPIVAFFRPCD